MKRKAFFFFFILSSVLLMLPTQLFAGAWTVGIGETYTELYNKLYWAEKNYDFEGHKVRMGYNGKYKEYRSELKIEYGIHNHINFLFSLPYKWGKYKNDYNTYRNDDIEFVSAGLKYRVLKENNSRPVVSLSLRAEIPGGYDKDEPPSLGHGESDGEIRLMAGKVFERELLSENIKIYHIGGEIGYRIKNNKIPYLLEFGIRIKDSLLLKGMIDGIIATSNSKIEPTPSQLIQKKYEEYSKFIFSIAISPSEMFGVAKRTEGFTFGIGYGYTFEGKNTAEGSEVILQLSYRF